MPESSPSTGSLRERTSNAAPAVLLVRPAAFGPNPETAATNALQGSPSEPAVETLRAAQREVDGLAAALAAAGVHAIVLEDSREPPKPDAVYPNNWVSFHADGTVVLYPLLSPLRRAEVRPELLAELREQHGALLGRVIDLSPLAARGIVLEGTGSLVLDRPRRLAFACRSARTTPAGLQAFAEATGYSVLAFDACDEQGRPYYHTNVLMAVGDRFALAALEAVPDQRERAAVRQALALDGRTLIELTRAQVRSFAGNVLEVETRQGGSALVLSTRALEALGQEARARLSALTKLVAVPFETIEDVGGGGVRCALAGLHCPFDATRPDSVRER